VARKKAEEKLAAKKTEEAEAAKKKAEAEEAKKQQEAAAVMKKGPAEHAEAARDPGQEEAGTSKGLTMEAQSPAQPEANADEAANAVAKRAEDETHSAAKRKGVEVLAAKPSANRRAEAIAIKQRNDETKAAKKKDEEEAAKKTAAARKKTEAEAAAKKKAEAEVAAKKAAAAEFAAKMKAEAEAAAKKMPLSSGPRITIFSPPGTSVSATPRHPKSEIEREITGSDAQIDECLQRLRNWSVEASAPTHSRILHRTQTAAIVAFQAFTWVCRRPAQPYAPSRK
jgi:hypothetical protein